MAQHVIEIQKRAFSVGNLLPGYSVMLNGREVGEIRRGLLDYQGTLPRITGEMVRPAGATVAEFRELAHAMNMEAREAIAAAENPSQKVIAVLQTSDPSKVCLVHRDDYGRALPVLVDFANAAYAKTLFGTEFVGIGFYVTANQKPEVWPELLLNAVNYEIGAEIPWVPQRRGSDLEIGQGSQSPIIRIIETENPETLIAIVAHGEMTDDQEPTYVTRESYLKAHELSGGFVTFRNLVAADPAPVLHPSDAAWLVGNHTWFDVHAGAPDAEERRARDMDRFMKQSMDMAAQLDFEP